ncbi:hypothetical protein GGR52DRAFT_538816, partial [Hypoxylon sp. FL1284]
MCRLARKWNLGVLVPVCLRNRAPGMQKGWAVEDGSRQRKPHTKLHRAVHVKNPSPALPLSLLTIVLMLMSVNPRIAQPPRGSAIGGICLRPCLGGRPRSRGSETLIAAQRAAPLSVPHSACYPSSLGSLAKPSMCSCSRGLRSGYQSSGLRYHSSHPCSPRPACQAQAKISILPTSPIYRWDLHPTLVEMTIASSGSYITPQGRLSRHLLCVVIGCRGGGGGG